MIVRSTAWLVVTGVGAALLLVIGFLVPGNSVVAIAMAGLVLLVGLTARQPVTLPILAMPASVIIQRVGGGGVDLSVSDFALFAAFWAAVFLAPRPFSRPMRSMLWISAIYQVATLFTVIANPFLANTVEWFHAWLLVGGSLVVGWAVGRGGRARLGLTLFLLPCIAIAVMTLITAVQQFGTGYAGVYLFDMHKNFIGTVLAFAALVTYVNPRWLDWPHRLAQATFLLLALGVVASEARQALIGLAAAIVVVILRPDPERRRSKVVLLAIIPAIFYVGDAAHEQLTEDNPFNSAFQRLAWYDDAMEVWRRSPWVGMGLRYWTAGRTEFGFQPPNAELEMLASAGVIGLTGFLILFGASLVVLWRVDPRFGTLAFAMVLMRFVQGQFDLFWVSVQASVPFLIVGVCLGAHAYALAQQDRDLEDSHPLPLEGRSTDEGPAVSKAATP